MNNKEIINYLGKVLILGNDNRSFLSVIRSMGRKRLCVHVGWCDKNICALKSKYISKIYNIPPFSLETDEWKRFLIDILRKEKYDLVIPCSDPVIIPLQYNRKDLEKYGKIYLLDDYSYKIANNKYKMHSLAIYLGVNVPNQIEITGLTKANDIVSKLNLPVVIKPRASYTKNNLNEKRHVKKVYSTMELSSFINNIKKNEVLVAQENFIGVGSGIEFISENGVILVAFQHIRVHEPLAGGGSSYRKSVELFPELLLASKKIIKAIKYTGVGMVEFKIDPTNNKNWIFIEFNARFWGSLPLPLCCGVDFPYYLYLMIVEKKKQFPTNYKTGIYCRNTSQDIEWILTNLKADRSDLTILTLPKYKVFLEIFNIILLKESNDTLVIDDLKPGIAEIGQIINKYFKKIVNKIFSTRFKFNSYRIMMKKKTVRNTIKAKKILFICKGNICRSPFAQYYLQSKNIYGIEIDSCGYYPQKGRLCTNEAVEAAKTYGIDLSTHRSKMVDEYLIERADIIYVFDEENYEYIIKNFLYVKNKIFLLSFLSTKTFINIKDPYNYGIDHYYETYKIIKEHLDLINVNYRNIMALKRRKKGQLLS